MVWTIKSGELNYCKAFLLYSIELNILSFDNGSSRRFTNDMR